MKIVLDTVSECADTVGVSGEWASLEKREDDMVDGLAVWCQSVSRDDDESFALFCRMADFIAEHPSVMESNAAHAGGMSFPEIRSLAERVL